MTNPNLVDSLMKSQTNLVDMTLNTQQLAKLKFDYCEKIIDDMDMDTLIQMAHDLLMDAYDAASEEDMKDEILDLYDNEVLDSLMEAATI